MHEAITETPAGSEIRYYHLVSSPIKDSDGRVQYVIELTEDITERKKAEESLDRANQEWERTFNAISDLVMVSGRSTQDPQGKQGHGCCPWVDGAGVDRRVLL